MSEGLSKTCPGPHTERHEILPRPPCILVVRHPPFRLIHYRPLEVNFVPMQHVLAHAHLRIDRKPLSIDGRARAEYLTGKDAWCGWRKTHRFVDASAEVGEEVQEARGGRDGGEGGKLGADWTGELFESLGVMKEVKDGG
ncbi:MAG: hypothetical protein Q9173_002101 [Seirophora scorigena]